MPEHPSDEEPPERKRVGPEGRQRMADAATGRQHSQETRRRIADTRTDQLHSEETKAKISEATRGREKSEEHRRAISEGVTRRWEARRVLAAVEEAMRQSGERGGDAELSALLASGGSTRAPDGSDALQEQYSMQLREYRNLQAELRPWMDAFAKVHGRKPTAADAAATGDECISARFAAKDSLRGRLLGEIPLMRKRLRRPAHRIGTAADDAGDDAPTGSALQQKGPVMNANQPALSREEASARVQSAFEYRKLKLQDLLQRKTAAAQGAAAAAPPPPTQTAPPPATKPQSTGASAALVGVGGNLRAKEALMKAMQYKKARAAEATAGPAVAPRATAPSRTAIKMVAVEGRTIGGVSYDVDASAAAAGESACVQTGSAHVTSYRNLPAQGDDDGLAASAASAASSDAAAGARGPAAATKASTVPAAPLPEARPDAGVRADRDVKAAPGDARTQSPAPAAVSGRLADKISADSLAALGALAADVQSEEGAVGVLLELRAKQAAATAAMAHAAATNAAANVERADCCSDSSASVDSSADAPVGQRPAGRRLLAATEAAKAEAANAVRDFEIARQRAKGLLQQSESTPWIARALSTL